MSSRRNDSRVRAHFTTVGPVSRSARSRISRLLPVAGWFVAMGAAVVLLSQCDMLPLVSTISVRVTGYSLPGEWSSPEVLATGSGSAWPHVAIRDSDGATIALWIAGGTSVEFALRNKNKWEPSKSLAQGSGFADLDVDYYDGNVAATWTDSSNTVRYAFYNITDYHQQSGSINMPGPGKEPSIALISNSGVAYVTWASSDDQTVYWAKVDRSTSWAPLAGNVPGFSPHIEVNADSSPARALIVYKSTDSKALCSISASSPTWTWSTTPQTIQSGLSIAAFDLDFGDRTSSSFANVIWFQQETDGSYDAQAARMAVDGTVWSPPAPLGGAQKVNDLPPRIAGKDNGDSIAFWQAINGPISSLYSGSTWSPKSTNGAPGSNAATIADARGGGGYYYITSESSGNIYTNIFNGYSGWGENVQLSTNGRAWYSTDNDPFSCVPSMAVDPAGHAVAIWANNDGGISATYYAPMQ